MSFCVPILIPGSLGQLSGLRVPDPPGDGQLQKLAHEIGNVLNAGNNNSSRYLLLFSIPMQSYKNEDGDSKITRRRTRL